MSEAAGLATRPVDFNPSLFTVPWMTYLIQPAKLEEEMPRLAASRDDALELIRTFLDVGRPTSVHAMRAGALYALAARVMIGCGLELSDIETGVPIVQQRDLLVAAARSGPLVSQPLTSQADLVRLRDSKASLMQVDSLPMVLLLRWLLRSSGRGLRPQYAVVPLDLRTRSQAIQVLLDVAAQPGATSGAEAALANTLMPVVQAELAHCEAVAQHALTDLALAHGEGRAPAWLDAVQAAEVLVDLGEYAFRKRNHVAAAARCTAASEALTRLLRAPGLDAMRAQALQQELDRLGSLVAMAQLLHGLTTRTAAPADAAPAASADAASLGAQVIAMEQALAREGDSAGVVQALAGDVWLEQLPLGLREHAARKLGANPRFVEDAVLAAALNELALAVREGDCASLLRRCAHPAGVASVRRALSLVSAARAGQGAAAVAPGVEARWRATLALAEAELEAAATAGSAAPVEGEVRRGKRPADEPVEVLHWRALEGAAAAAMAQSDAMWRTNLKRARVARGLQETEAALSAIPRVGAECAAPLVRLMQLHAAGAREEAVRVHTELVAMLGADKSALAPVTLVHSLWALLAAPSGRDFTGRYECALLLCQAFAGAGVGVNTTGATATAGAAGAAGAAAGVTGATGATAPVPASSPSDVAALLAPVLDYWFTPEASELHDGPVPGAENRCEAAKCWATLLFGSGLVVLTTRAVTEWPRTAGVLVPHGVFEEDVRAQVGADFPVKASAAQALAPELARSLLEPALRWLGRHCAVQQTRGQWLMLRADLLLHCGRQREALACYLSGLNFTTRLFTTVRQQLQLDVVTVGHLVACLSALGCRVQAAALVQFLPAAEHARGCSLLSGLYDASEEHYLQFLWEMTLLEAAMHAAVRNRLTGRVALLTALIAQPDRNEFNAPRVRPNQYQSGQYQNGLAARLFRALVRDHALDGLE